MPDRPVPADHEQVKQITAWGVAIMSGIWGTPDQRPAAEDALDALVAALAAAEKERDEAREELRENDRIVERAWRDRDAETERAVTAETALREVRQQLEDQCLMNEQARADIEYLRNHWQRIADGDGDTSEDTIDGRLYWISDDIATTESRAVLARAAVPAETDMGGT
jgi:hypothetical protein